MSSRTVLGVAVACALGGAAAGWLSRGAAEPARANDATLGEEAGVRMSGAPTLGTDAGLARARIIRLEKELEGAKRENEDLRKEIAAARVDMAHRGVSERISAAMVLKGPRYGYEKLEKTLNDIDWKKTAGAVVGMTPHMRELGEALAEGKSADEPQRRIQKHNLPLIKTMITVQQGGVPGHGINGPLTHPAVVVNLVYATLIEAGLPLDEKQAKQLSEIGDRYVHEDGQLRAGFTNATWRVEKLVGESDLKDRLYKDIDAMLSAEQRAFLHPGEMRDRLGDLFSAGLLWMRNSWVAQGADRAGIASSASRTLIEHLKIPESDRETVERAVGDWMRTFEEDALYPLDGLEEQNILRMDRIRRASGPMVALYHVLGRDLHSSPDVVKRLRESAAVLVPVLGSR